VLQPLTKLAQEIGLSESDAQRILTYQGGLRRIGGLYDDGGFYLLYIQYLHEKLYGVVATEKRFATKPGVQKKKIIRGHLSGRKRAAAKTPWAFVPGCDSRKSVV
jgi:hypothetical protein